MRFYTKNLSHILLTAFDRAEHSIEISVYRLKDPAVLGALSRATDRGVRVTIRTDKGSKVYPGFTWKRVKSKGIMHEKIVLIDGHIAYVGSANLTEDSLLAHKNLIVGVYSKQFVEMLQNESPWSVVNVGKYDFEVWRLPQPNDAPIRRLVELLNASNHSIDLSMYTFTHQKLIDAVIDAHKRGVQLKLDLDRNSRIAIKRFENENIPINIANRYPLTHNKNANIDNNTFIYGSTNWTNRAFNKNKDILIIINKRQL